MKDLRVIHDDNGAFVDYSADAADFLRDNFTVNFTATEDKLYVGLYKPFSEFYFELDSGTGKTLTYKINGTGINVKDDTRDFSRSGFIHFDKPTNWLAETINGVEGYWLEITANLDFIDVVTGINIVYADDIDLKTEIRNIDILLAKGDKSFIAYHQGVREEIIQTLRNGGYLKHADDEIAELTKWDLLDIGEVRNAAKYLCLAKIFFDVSKNNDDKYYLRFRDFQGMYGNAFDTYILKLDTKDDGIYEEADDLEFNSDIEIVLG
jgi:hypothetical protein